MPALRLCGPLPAYERTRAFGELRPDPLRELCVDPIFARDKEALRPAWHIEIKYGGQAAVLGPGELLVFILGR